MQTTLLASILRHDSKVKNAILSQSYTGPIAKPHEGWRGNTHIFLHGPSWDLRKIDENIWWTRPRWI